MTGSGLRGAGRRRWAALAGRALAASVAIAGVMVAPPVLSYLVPREVVRAGVGLALRSALGLYLAGLAVALPAAVALGAAILRSRRRGGRSPRKARAWLVASSWLVASLILEGTAAAWRARDLGGGAIAAPRFSTAPADRIDLVVVGESTAIGMPFDPGVSIGPIVAWQLRRVFPGREVAVDIRALGGLNLREALARLRDVDRRPDAVILYSGHNEFQSMYRLGREAEYYADQVTTRARATRLIRSASPACDLLLETLDRREVDAPPPPSTARRLADTPACTDEERGRIEARFRAALGRFYDYCERAGALPIVFVPAGNDGDFEPSRSSLDPATTPPARERFEVDFRAAVALAATDPRAGEAAIGRLVAVQAGFAEGHFRLGRLLEARGDFGGAARHYAEARDRDGMPLRCTSALQAAVREVSGRREGILIEAEGVLRPLGPGLILGRRQFLDAHHPGLVGYTALAREVLRQLRLRKAFGWPDDRPEPEFDAAGVAEHFGLRPEDWAKACRRSARFYEAVAPIRFEPDDRRTRAKGYDRAAGQILAGAEPDRVGIEALGTGPVRTSYR